MKEGGRELTSHLDSEMYNLALCRALELLLVGLLVVQEWEVERGDTGRCWVCKAERGACKEEGCEEDFEMHIDAVFFRRYMFLMLCLCVARRDVECRGIEMDLYT